MSNERDQCEENLRLIHEIETEQSVLNLSLAYLSNYPRLSEVFERNPLSPKSATVAARIESCGLLFAPLSLEPFNGVNRRVRNRYRNIRALQYGGLLKPAGESVLLAGAGYVFPEVIAYHTEVNIVDITKYKTLLDLWSQISVERWEQFSKVFNRLNTLGDAVSFGSVNGLARKFTAFDNHPELPEYLAELSADYQEFAGANAAAINFLPLSYKEYRRRPHEDFDLISLYRVEPKIIFSDVLRVVSDHRRMKKAKFLDKNLPEDKLGQYRQWEIEKVNELLGFLLSRLRKGGQIFITLAPGSFEEARVLRVMLFNALVLASYSAKDWQMKIEMFVGSDNQERYQFDPTSIIAALVIERKSVTGGVVYPPPKRLKLLAAI